MAVAFGLLITALVIASFVAYLVFVNRISYAELSAAVIVTILVAFSIYVLWDRARNVSKGLPAKDERLEKINYKAGYYGFIAAIGSAVGGPLLTDILFDRELEGHLVTAVVVIVSGFVFVISYLYLTRKGN
jgi:hypothetical protein